MKASNYHINTKGILAVALSSVLVITAGAGAHGKKIRFAQKQYPLSYQNRENTEMPMMEEAIIPPENSMNKEYSKKKKKIKKDNLK